MMKRVEKRLFNDTSFWNQKITQDVDISPESANYVELLKQIDDSTGFNINIDNWTIPVYYADKETPRYELGAKIMDCYLSQGHLIASEPYLTDDHPKGVHPSVKGGVPIPRDAEPDREHDAHMTIIDLDERKCYDMWQVGKQEDGSWATNSAIAYDLDGSGVYNLEDFAHVHNDESIHYYGPCRASGVPAIAGLIMHHEIEQGVIEHKLAFACMQVGLQQFVSPPAIWTDGWHPDGIPEGMTMQLDPDLDLDSLGLSEVGKIVAKALQEYGAVLVDYGDGAAFYAEGLFGVNDERSWNGILSNDDLAAIGYDNYRFIKPEKVINRGSHPIYHGGISVRYYKYLQALKTVPEQASPLNRIHD